MTTIVRLEITPVQDESMADEIAKAVNALDEFDVTYEMTPMNTIIEADAVEEVFAAAQAAHNAIDGERVITSLELDDQRNRDQHADERVDAAEQALGRQPRRER